MEEKKMIHSAINGIMSDIGYIGKDRQNLQQKFMFRGIDQVMNTLKPLLAKHGVFIVPEVLNMQREERQTERGGHLMYSILTIKHHFVATDGSEVCTTTVGEGMDSGDKASNKAMSIAFKYACFQIFCIPTEEMANDDPELTSPGESVNAIFSHIAAATTTEDLKMLWMSLGPREKSDKAIVAAFSEAKRRLQATVNPNPTLNLS